MKMVKPSELIQKVVDFVKDYLAERKQKKPKFIESGLKLLDSISSIDQETKVKIRPHIEEHLAEAFDAETVTLNAPGLIALIFVVLILFLFFILIILFISLLITHQDLSYAGGYLFILMLAISFLLLFWSQLKSAIAKKLYRDYAYSMLVYNLLKLLHDSQTPVHFDLDFYWRQKRTQLWQLEAIAQIIEHSLPSQIIDKTTYSKSNNYKKSELMIEFKTVDDETETWLREMFKQVATAIRDKKKWLLTPKEDTREYFVKSMTSTFIAFVEGNLDALERIEQTKTTSLKVTDMIVELLSNVMSTILKASFPIVALYFVQQTPYKLTGTLYTTAISIIVLWEVTVVANFFDPNFIARITDIKEISSLWQGLGKGGSEK